MRDLRRITLNVCPYIFAIFIWLCLSNCNEGKDHNDNSKADTEIEKTKEQPQKVIKDKPKENPEDLIAKAGDLRMSGNFQEAMAICNSIISNYPDKLEKEAAERMITYIKDDMAYRGVWRCHCTNSFDHLVVSIDTSHCVDYHTLVFSYNDGWFDVTLKQKGKPNALKQFRGLTSDDGRWPDGAPLFYTEDNKIIKREGGNLNYNGEFYSHISQDESL